MEVVNLFNIYADVIEKVFKRNYTGLIDTDRVNAINIGICLILKQVLQGISLTVNQTSIVCIHSEGSCLFIRSPEIAGIYR